MALLIDDIRALIDPSRRHKQYCVADYISYCQLFRSVVKAVEDRSFRNSDVAHFFEKQFVEEMEVLARICARRFGSDSRDVAVQYVEQDPPDGIITLADGDRIFVECTSARDSRWETFALEQLREPGRLVSCAPLPWDCG